MPQDGCKIISINDEDVQAFMEVSHGLQCDSLDIIMHSPVGLPEP